MESGVVDLAAETFVQGVFKEAGQPGCEDDFADLVLSQAPYAFHILIENEGMS